MCGVFGGTSSDSFVQAYFFDLITKGKFLNLKKERTKIFDAVPPEGNVI